MTYAGRAGWWGESLSQDTRCRMLDPGYWILEAGCAGCQWQIGTGGRPAVGQGALCIEIREDDSEIKECVGALDHRETRVTVLGERAFLNRLEGSCQVPVAGFGRHIGNSYVLQGLVADIEGNTIIRDSLSGDMAESEEIGAMLADRLLGKGAKEILDFLKANADEG